MIKSYNHTANAISVTFFDDGIICRMLTIIVCENGSDVFLIIYVQILRFDSDLKS